MTNVLIIVAFASVAYLLAHKVVDTLRERFLIATGAEYILVGLLLGPEMPWSPAFEREALLGMNPLMVLAVGWVGLLYGMNANVRHLVQTRDGSGTVAITEVVVTGGIVGLGSFFLLGTGWFGHFSGAERFAAVWAMAASAAVGSASVVDLVRRRFSAKGQLTDCLDRSSRLGELLSIVAFGLLFCFHRSDSHAFTQGWDYANWILLTLGLGLGLGLIFRLFLGSETDPDKQFLALLGIVVFASGAAQFLHVSPLLVNLVLGIVLANVAPNSEQIYATLSRYHRAMIIVMLVFAGLLWRPVPMVGLGMVGAYVVLRGAGKMLGGRVAAASVPGGLRKDLGRGLLGHGEVAVAMALGLRLVYQGPAMDLVFTAILLSVLLGEIWSARAVRRLLLDGGEIEAGGILASAPQPPEEDALALVVSEQED